MKKLLFIVIFGLLGCGASPTGHLKMGQHVIVTSGFYSGCTGFVVQRIENLTVYYTVDAVCSNKDVTYSLQIKVPNFQLETDIN